MNQYTLRRFNYRFSDNKMRGLEWLFIFVLSMIPLLFEPPFRINIFLSWEGAYRLYLGQIPYKDFGIPLGFTYWIIPAIFFYFFGPYMYSLIIAQVFVNILSAFFFLRILSFFKVDSFNRFFSLLVFILSFSLVNYWPWYNHMVFVFGLGSIYFILKYLDTDKFIHIALSIFFTLLSISTKQDSGGLTLLIILSVLVIEYLYTKNWKGFAIYSVGLVVLSIILILPFIQYDFFYWFNYGQEPHSSRLKVLKFIDLFLSGLMWEKFYLMSILFLIMFRFREIINDKIQFLFLFITTSLIFHSFGVKVTSIIAHEQVAYFHGFVVSFLLYQIGDLKQFQKLMYLLVFIALPFLWWSENYWGYFNFIFKDAQEKTYSLTDEDKKLAAWSTSKYASLQNIRIPEQTENGIDFLVENFSSKNIEVLNMTELTSLAFELGYAPPKDIPLWFHEDVVLFEREKKVLAAQIKQHKYDLVLFQTIPQLENFFPEDLKSILLTEYELIKEFPAPRKHGQGYSYIQVFKKKEGNELKLL